MTLLNASHRVRPEKLFYRSPKPPKEGPRAEEEYQSKVFAYALAPISVAACVVLRYMCGHVLHDRGRLITFTLAVAVSSLVGGVGPGLLAIVLGLIAGITLFMHPMDVVLTHPPEIALAVIFLANSLVMCWLSGSRDRAARAARLLNRDLEKRVDERTALAEERTTALEASRKALHEQAELLGSILDSIGDAVFVIDDCSHVLRQNRAARRLFGDATPADLKVTHSGAEITLTDVLQSRPKADDEIVIDRPAGKAWFTINVRPLTCGTADHQMHGAVTVLHDVTQRKLAETDIRNYQKRLRSLASELTLTEQRERRRIAVDLHDHIAHLLVMCKLKLSSLNHNSSGVAGESDLTSVDQIKHALDEAIGYTRSLIFRLSPPVLYELGLGPALEWLAGQFRTQHNLAVEVRNDDRGAVLGEDVRVAFFQSARELLFNIVKHAGCSRAIVSLIQADGQVRLTVQDQGKGFDPKATAPGPLRADGLGLFSIRERIDLLGGTVEIASAPSRGTRVTMTAPLAVLQTATVS